jgi:guanylate kinase
LVLSSPSGAGKTSLSRRILAEDQGITMSVSATTRPPRSGEVAGRDYHFVSDAEFDRLLEADAFLEWAHVFDYRYGTLRAPVEAGLAAGADMLFDIDWQGTQQIRQRAAGDLVGVFILPPSMEELGRRLQSRGSDSADVIARRMERAAAEISHWPEYDYVLVNSELDDCLVRVRTILAAERLRRSRQSGLTDFVRGLLGASGG